jgi:hypothetical protein
VSPTGSCALPHGTSPPNGPDLSTRRQADTVTSVRQQHTNQRRPGSLPMKRLNIACSAPTADWRGKPVCPGRQTRKSPPYRATGRNPCSLVADVYRGPAATPALMGVGESIITVWGATMGGWHGRPVIHGRHCHCVGGGLYKGHIEMYIGTHHPLAQN